MNIANHSEWNMASKRNHWEVCWDCYNVLLEMRKIFNIIYTTCIEISLLQCIIFKRIWDSTINAIYFCIPSYFLSIVCLDHKFFPLNHLSRIQAGSQNYNYLPSYNPNNSSLHLQVCISENTVDLWLKIKQQKKQWRRHLKAFLSISDTLPFATKTHWI